MSAQEARAVKCGIAAASLGVAVAGLASAEWFASKPRLSAVANMFTAGLIVSTALVHLLADASESETSAFPWECMLLGVGYGVMLSIEQWALAAKSSSSRSEDDEEAHYAPISRIELSDEEEEIETEQPHSHVGGSAVAATVALVVHSVGDGASIALQSSSRELSAISAAILIHKFFAASALGTVLARAFGDPDPTLRKGRRRSRTKNFVYALAFALTTPVVILAVVVGGTSISTDTDAIGRITALCAGSLLYVGIHEILPLGLHASTIHLCTKLSLFWSGFLSMSLLAVWV
mmetsp:Transcript_12017/g.36152  ORF Transcript_12017/g.36152 Transcript_12017/m.36152 type:complete len:292 (-) Transcript_12017:84-959(-)